MPQIIKPLGAEVIGVCLTVPRRKEATLLLDQPRSTWSTIAQLFGETPNA